MVKALIGFVVLILANIYWVHRAGKNWHSIRYGHSPSNPFVRSAERNYSTALGMLLIELLLLIALIFAGVEDGQRR